MVELTPQPQQSLREQYVIERKRFLQEEHEEKQRKLTESIANGDQKNKEWKEKLESIEQQILDLKNEIEGETRKQGSHLTGGSAQFTNLLKTPQREQLSRALDNEVEKLHKELKQNEEVHEKLISKLDQLAETKFDEFEKFIDQAKQKKQVPEIQTFDQIRERLQKLEEENKKKDKQIKTLKEKNDQFQRSQNSRANPIFGREFMSGENANAGLGQGSSKNLGQGPHGKLFNPGPQFNQQSNSNPLPSQPPPGSLFGVNNQNDIKKEKPKSSLFGT